MTQSHARQMVGSLIAAVLIVLLTITLVTAKLGSDGERPRDEREQEDDDYSGRGQARQRLMFATAHPGISGTAPVLLLGR